MRPPGAHPVDPLNDGCDFDAFWEWARAVTGRRSPARMARRYNVATIRKRARGQGTLHSIEGLDETDRNHAATIAWNNLRPVGASRRDGRPTRASHGFLLIRPPDLPTTPAIADAIADAIGARVQLHAR